jgi:uncharacterized protein YndB with AHSA1/START domain
MADEAQTVGKTADVGYQIGVRRTLPCGEEALWSLVLSPEGQAIWLGGAIELADGARYALDNGTTGQVRVYKPWSHIRLTWQPQGWARPSTVQVRVTAASSGTTLSFHQEHLADSAARSAMKAHWERVIEQLAAKL